MRAVLLAAVILTGCAPAVASLSRSGSWPTATAVPTAVPTATPAPTPTPEPTVAPTAVPEHVHRASGPVGCSSWRPLISSHFPAGEVNRACSVMMCESRGDPNAVSPTSDHGLWQANKATWDKPDHPQGWQQTTGTDWSQTHDPGISTKWAAWLWARSGWSPWACARIVGIL